LKVHKPSLPQKSALLLSSSASSAAAAATVGLWLRVAGLRGTLGFAGGALSGGRLCTQPLCRTLLLVGLINPVDILLSCTAHSRFNGVFVCCQSQCRTRPLVSTEKPYQKQNISSAAQQNRVYWHADLFVVATHTLTACRQCSTTALIVPAPACKGCSAKCFSPAPGAAQGLATSHKRKTRQSGCSSSCGSSDGVQRHVDLDSPVYGSSIWTGMQRQAVRNTGTSTVCFSYHRCWASGPTWAVCSRHRFWR
jgi:hypothetical protein